MMKIFKNTMKKVIATGALLFTLGVGNADALSFEIVDTTIGADNKIEIEIENNDNPRENIILNIEMKLFEKPYITTPTKNIKLYK